MALINSVLGIIPARGGSKGIPEKNIKILNGKPLLQYTIEAALESELLSRVILSTDDSKIAEVGRTCGVEVPFIRPKELAMDDTSSLLVVQHAVSVLKTIGDSYDAICLLQPTSPLRKTETIDACITLLFDSQADAVVTVLPVPYEYNPHWVYFRRPDGELYLSMGDTNPVPRRQLLPPAFHREGSVYVTRVNVVMDKGSLYGDRLIGYPVNPSESVNIDNMEDWKLAEKLVKKNSSNDK
ncbi:acylneuraminate cytidylyltransferase family protein [archaeon]|nr:acylneuraminate cytidylyltransferase family protein [archaeon]